MPQIHTFRRQKVVIDADLARLYDVPTKRLNEAVRRNHGRFPEDFSFMLSSDEAAELATSTGNAEGQNDKILRSQSATLKNDRRGRHRKYPPRVFTEHGALMAANVLRSQKAVEMSLYLVRAFVQMRDTILANSTILRRLAEIDHRLIEHDSVLRDVIERLQPLLDAPPIEEENKPRIGFHQGNR